MGQKACKTSYTPSNFISLNLPEIANILMRTIEETIETAKEVFKIEADSILQLETYLDASFYEVIRIIYSSKGRLVITGIGKSAIIANKIVATLNSTGTPAIFMHAADAIHGDLGIIQKEDVIIAISNSGNTPEIKLLVPWLKDGGNTLIGMVGNGTSFLAENSDFILNTTVLKEACPNQLAPTSSTTAQLAMGDALAVCLLSWRDFTADDFAKFHPGGALGKKLYLRVSELYPNNEKPQVLPDATLNQVILEITSKRLGATMVVDENNVILGMITDGDLRRLLNNLGTNISDVRAREIMSPKPKTIDKDELAFNALEIMRRDKITQLVVTHNNEYLGMIHIHDLNREGLIN
jgi:arabinose-5-phosphate isomerase